MWLKLDITIMPKCSEHIARIDRCSFKNGQHAEKTLNCQISFSVRLG